MELVIAETEAPDRFQWITIYDGPMGRQVRNYELVVRDAAKGLYAIDEKNGIIIEARLLDGALYSNFLVQGTRIVTREKLEGAGGADDRLSIEMLVSRESEGTSTGNTEEVPEVMTWRPTSLQRGTLRRVPAPAPAAAPTAAPTTSPGGAR